MICVAPYKVCGAPRQIVGYADALVAPRQLLGGALILVAPYVTFAGVAARAVNDQRNGAFSELRIVARHCKLPPNGADAFEDAMQALARLVKALKN